MALLRLGHGRRRLGGNVRLLALAGALVVFSAGQVMAVTLSLPMSIRDGSCLLDHAEITAVPPDTFKALIAWQCGKVMCWQRYVDVNGQRSGNSFVCEMEQGDALAPPAPAGS